MTDRKERRLMVVKSVKVVYCDKCGIDGGTERYTVTFPHGPRRVFDLCGPCSAPLQELTGLLSLMGDRGPKTHQQPTLSEDEVEARIANAKKKPRKGSSRARSTA